jgi:hypothetical protein
MNRGVLLLLILVFLVPSLKAQERLDSLRLPSGIRVTLDEPHPDNRPVLLIFYALPNGNSTEQTMGRTPASAAEWRFDIQHIRAQTRFIRKVLPRQRIVVAYLENREQSWPRWCLLRNRCRQEIVQLIDSVAGRYRQETLSLYLNGHSGGGRLLLAYLEGAKPLHPALRRISFIDSNYGYDSTHQPLLLAWLRADKRNTLTVFAYNDSIVRYGGKPIVSAEGGTWYRSGLMLRHLQPHFRFRERKTDSLRIATSTNKQILFALKENKDGGIYHTQQVAQNGFIHSVLYRKEREERGYTYYGKRAYEVFIRKP